MTYIVRLDLCRRQSILSIVDADTGETLTSDTMYRVSLGRVFKLRNQLCESLAEEADAVETKTYDWRN